MMKENLFINPISNQKSMTTNHRITVSDSLRRSGIEKDKFQFLFLKTVEKSQSDIDRNNRLKNSNAKDIGTGQPRVSDQQKAQLNSIYAEHDQTENDKNQQRVALTQQNINPVDSEIINQLLSNNSSTDRLVGIAYASEFEKNYLNQSHIHSSEKYEESADEVDKVDRYILDSGSDDKHSMSELQLTISDQESDDQTHQDQTENQQSSHASENYKSQLINTNAYAVSSLKNSGYEVMSYQAAPPVFIATLENRFGTEYWSTEFNQKIVWMTRGAEQSAILTLNPPNLGPIKVHVKVLNQVAHTIFESSNPEVRHALEGGLPKLREMLGDKGIEMGDVCVKEGLKNDLADISNSFRSSSIFNVFV